MPGTDYNRWSTNFHGRFGLWNYSIKISRLLNLQKQGLDIYTYIFTLQTWWRLPNIILLHNIMCMMWWTGHANRSMLWHALSELPHLILWGAARGTGHWRRSPIILLYAIGFCQPGEAWVGVIRTFDAGASEVNIDAKIMYNIIAPPTMAAYVVYLL